jgi:dolichyl-phosphate-mannose--protein O-mannosyl transferase
MNMQNLLMLVIGAGLITVFFEELFKQQWKAIHPTTSFPSWLGLTIGVVLSAVVAFLFTLAWMPQRTIWSYLIYVAATFLFQYFVSLEIAKRIIKAVLKKSGINIESATDTTKDS